MSRSSTRSRRSTRGLLASVIVVASIGWVGPEHSIAAAPAELVSVAPNGAPLVDSSDAPSISGDGNIVVVNTSAFDFSIGNGIPVYTVYVRNRANGTTSTIPGLPPEFVTYPGTANGVVSRDGCHVAFWGRWYFDFAAGQWNIYTWNRCVAGSGAQEVATNVLDAREFPGVLATSADGRYIAYIAQSASGTPPHIARIDTTALTESVLTAQFTTADSIDISDDGKFVAIGGTRQTVPSAPPTSQVLGWTAPCTTTCTTEVISVGRTGAPASGFSDRPSVSADGRFVAFTSDSVDIVGLGTQPSRQVYVRDRVNKVTKLVTDTPGVPMPAGLGVDNPDISPDGTQIALTQTDGFETSEVWVARSSSAVLFDTAVFDLVSFGVSGAPVSGPGAFQPSMSSNGRYVAFASPANTELSGGTVPDGSTQTWVRQRPIALDITPTVDFGAVDLNVQSPPKSVIVTNTSGVEINIAAVLPPAAPFSITANSCGGVLAAGATCSVTLVFRPTVPGGASSTVTVSGDGLSVSAALVGTGRAPGLLKITPTVASYGNAVVGTTIAAKDFVVSNIGQTAVPIATVTLNGSGSDQFTLASNGCTGTLAVGGNCTVSVGATVTRNGSFSATLRVTGTGGQLVQATLRLGGAFNPTLKMNPGVASPGEVTAALGEGFPPNIDVQLAFNGETPFATVHTDGGGAFRYDLVLLPHGERIGGRQVVAVDQPQFSGVFAPLLIELATSRPSGFAGSVLTSGIRNLLTRGG